MGTKHTPGEWMLPHFVTNKNEPKECQCRYVLSENYCGCICSVEWSPDRELVNGDNPPLEEAIANAKLICAAPKLLEKLQYMVDAWEDVRISGRKDIMDEFTAYAKDTIKKAIT